MAMANQIATFLNTLFKIYVPLINSNTCDLLAAYTKFQGLRPKPNK